MDLAQIYGVTTKALNQSVKRNGDRFPNDFAFFLSEREKAEVVTNCDHLSRVKFSPEAAVDARRSVASVVPPGLKGLWHGVRVGTMDLAATPLGLMGSPWPKYPG